MVIPWQGFSLNQLINKIRPLSGAKYIQFETVYRPEEMPGQKRNVLPWPYVEGLRMDEALNPLTILSTGLYGHNLLNQNGAPFRLVVPWKYGFKSIKSIVTIRFVKNEPGATWPIVNSKEYIEKLYEKTFDEGIDCEYCEYSKSILEPHGEITRHCSMEHYHEECPSIENALNYYN